MCHCPCTLLWVVQPTVDPVLPVLFPWGLIMKEEDWHPKTLNTFALSSTWPFVRYQWAYLPISISLRQAGTDVARSMSIGFSIGQIWTLSLVSWLLQVSLSLFKFWIVVFIDCPLNTSQRQRYHVPNTLAVIHSPSSLFVEAMSATCMAFLFTIPSHGTIFMIY